MPFNSLNSTQEFLYLLPIALEQLSLEHVPLNESNVLFVPKPIITTNVYYLKRDSLI